MTARVPVTIARQLQVPNEAKDFERWISKIADLRSLKKDKQRFTCHDCLHYIEVEAGMVAQVREVDETTLPTTEKCFFCTKPGQIRRVIYQPK